MYLLCAKEQRRADCLPVLTPVQRAARVFGNLLDPKSEIRFVLKHKKVFRLKEDLGTDPKYWYFID